MTSWSRPGRCSGGCVICRPGWGVLPAGAGDVPTAGLCAGVGQADRRAVWPAGSLPVGEGAARPAPTARPGAAEGPVRDSRQAAGPAGNAGGRFGGLRTVAFDGCNSVKVPDTGRNRWWLGRIRYRMGFAGYPTLRLMTLAETGTRGLLGAALGSAADRDEATVARRLLPLLRPGMLVLLDRAFNANLPGPGRGHRGAAAGKGQVHPPPARPGPPARWLLPVAPGRAEVRIIEASVTVTGADGSPVRDGYRLITTLMDYRRFPVAAVVRLAVSTPTGPTVLL